MCCTAAKWKREEVPDHKFDFIDVNDFYDSSCIRRIAYLFLFAVIVKNILVYTADLWTAYLLIASASWARNLQTQQIVPLETTRWIFFASIVCSFLLLLWELRKAIRVVKSRDIAYAYTCTGAYRLYSIRSYAHFCLFSQINNSRKKTDRLAFFVYFTLKGWKRFLLAEAPRQVVNGMALYGIYISARGVKLELFFGNGADYEARVAFALMTFTFGIWAISAILMGIAGLLYVPLLCQIRGNLKEYVCHKIDKRLALLLRKKSRKRILIEHQERLRQQQEIQALPSTNAVMFFPSREPTLPRVEIGLGPRDALRKGKRTPPPPTFGMKNPGKAYSDHESMHSTGRRRADSHRSSASGYSQPRHGPMMSPAAPMPPMPSQPLPHHPGPQSSVPTPLPSGFGVPRPAPYPDGKAPYPGHCSTSQPGHVFHDQALRPHPPVLPHQMDTGSYEHPPISPTKFGRPVPPPGLWTYGSRPDLDSDRNSHVQRKTSSATLQRGDMRQPTHEETASRNESVGRESGAENDHELPISRYNDRDRYAAHCHQQRPSLGSGQHRATGPYSPPQQRRHGDGPVHF